MVAELARRIDFGLAIFHLISSFTSKSLSWAISLVGAPNDPETALRLLVKVHRHGGMRGQLASLLLLALPPHLQQLIPAAVDSRAAPTALVALIEAHVHMRIPKSPFLYWYVIVNVACFASSSTYRFTKWTYLLAAGQVAGAQCRYKLSSDDLAFGACKARVGTCGTVAG